MPLVLTQNSSIWHESDWELRNGETYDQKHLSAASKSLMMRLSFGTGMINAMNVEGQLTGERRKAERDEMNWLYGQTHAQEMTNDSFMRDGQGKRVTQRKLTEPFYTQGKDNQR